MLRGGSHYLCPFFAFFCFKSEPTKELAWKEYIAIQILVFSCNWNPQESPFEGPAWIVFIFRSGCLTAGRVTRQGDWSQFNFVRTTHRPKKKICVFFLKNAFFIFTTTAVRVGNRICLFFGMKRFLGGDGMGIFKTCTSLVFTKKKIFFSI